MITRRNFLTTSAATGLALAGSGVGAPAIAKGAKLRVGYVSPQTGPLAGFAESDAYNIKAFLGSDAGKNFEVIAKDSQSNPNRGGSGEEPDRRRRDQPHARRLDAGNHEPGLHDL